MAEVLSLKEVWSLEELFVGVIPQVWRRAAEVLTVVPAKDTFALGEVEGVKAFEAASKALERVV